MNRIAISFAATACLAAAALHAADYQLPIRTLRHRAAHQQVLLTVRAQRAADNATAAAGTNPHLTLWRSFDVPAAVNGTQPSAINDLGEVTGVYYDSNNYQHGFLRKCGGEMVTFDAPSVGYGTQAGLPYLGLGTIPTGINNEGQVVGYFSDAAGAYHGFVRSKGGNFRVLDDPSSTSSPTVTIAQAINDWGEVVGYWYDSSGNYHGFVHRIHGVFATVEPSGAVYSQAYHINDRGEVGGDWTDAATGASHGMLMRNEGRLLTFDAPGAVTTFGGLGQALNFEGTFAGTLADPNYGAHGYVRYSDGKFTEFTAPNAGNSNFNGTWAASINLLGTVVGFSYEQNGAPIDAYVRFANGTLILANAPVAGQQTTVAWAINDLNEFTGFWIDASGAEHGFVALAVP